MGNLRQSMTDEEWNELENKNDNYITGSDSYQKYMFRWQQQMEMEWNKTSTVDKLTSNVIEAPKDTNTRAVMEDLKSRADVGLRKYNTTLGENNHQNMLQHAYEEALDLAQYLKKEITTLNTVQDLVKQYSNNQELGAEIRKRYGQK